VNKKLTMFITNFLIQEWKEFGMNQW